MGSDQYIVDSILPKRELHLLGGPSGAGKTRWLLPMLLDWEEGLPVLGHKSYPSSWVYFACDRSVESITRTMKSMNIDIGRINVVPAWDREMRWVDVLEEINRRKEELVVIESFGSFIEGHHTGMLVKQHIQETYRNMRYTGKTIIGIVESPKQKSGYDRYENPRQRISGAAAWSHFTETIMLVEPSDASDPTCASRQLYVCPRNGAMQNMDMAFDPYGHLRPSHLNIPNSI